VGAVRTLCVGVTGSAGAGKSTLCDLWMARGAERVDADAIGRALLLRGSPVHAEIVAAFGASVLGPAGDIDRAALGSRVFADRAELSRLNSLVHPPLIAELHRRLDRFRARPGPSRIVLMDAALLAEWGDSTLWDRLVAVLAPRLLKVARLVQQRGFTEARAAAVLESQWSDAERARLADYVVNNDGDLEILERQASSLWVSWQALLT
jgi:dephospho-CoA kinase